MSKEIIGIFFYMVLEFLIEGVKVVDVKSDIYFFGYIFYELVMGENFWCYFGWYKLEDFIKYLI